MKIDVFTQDILTAEVDYLVIGVVEGQEVQGDAFTRINESLDGYLETSLENGIISNKKNKITVIHTLGKITAKQILIVGLGKLEAINYKSVRDCTIRTVKEIMKGKNNRTNRILVHFSDYINDNLTPSQLSHAIAEGAYLGAYAFADYKRDKPEKASVELLLVAGNQEVEAELEKGLKTGVAFGSATNLAKDYVNTPANLLTPEILAEYAVEVGKRYHMEVDVLDQERMEALGMGALLAVAQGSVHAPRLVVIKYQGRDTWDNVIGFVGKGVTFDSGGISIKPVAGMELMVSDMAGAAAVIGAMEAIGQLQPKVNILAVIPMVENLPSGTAYRPGDVLTSMSGRTIEVISTDAEGRLILADAITYAKQLGVSSLVDVATLTGSALFALGTKTTAAITNNNEWISQVLGAADEVGEYMWQLPAFDVYREQYLGRVSDLKNSGGPRAGCITAGMFLGEFAEDTPWVHLDIAGTSWQREKSEMHEVGATGAMVRTLTQLALNHNK